MSKLGNTRQRGFTIIELVMVIVILGILSAFALPRLANFSDDANIASVSGTGGAFKSAIAIAHSAWIVGGFSGPVDNLDIYGTGTNLMDMNANGWPAQSWFPFEANPTLNNTNDCISVWGAVLEGGGPTVATNTSQDYQVSYSANTCTYSLVDEPRLSIFYDSNTGEVAIDSVL